MIRSGTFLVHHVQRISERLSQDFLTNSLDRIMATSCHWTYSSHIRHPWFDSTIMKRKHCEAVSPDEEDTPFPMGATASTKTPPLKRRRKYSNLENGFAHMSLGGSAVSAAPSAPLPWSSSASYPSVQEFVPPINLNMDADMRTLPNPTNSVAYTVEEPDIPEVTMKTSSWYEPEPDSKSGILHSHP